MTMNIDLNWLQSQFPEITGLQQIGRGGQKIVLAGCHAANGEVVLKLFHLHADAERVAREVRAYDNISSARLPRVYEQGVLPSPIGDLLWVREQRILGQSMRDRMKYGSLTDLDVLRLALHALETLAAAEHARIVHRDIKPDNIIVDLVGSAWLIDFGFARFLDLESLTASALAFGHGTAGYAPPEQFRNQKPDIDSRADLFALGVTLFEAVEGINPFREGARDTNEILRRVENNALPPLSRHIDVKAEFCNLVEAMTRTRRDHRLRTAAEALTWMQEIWTSESR